MYEIRYEHINEVELIFIKINHDNAWVFILAV